MLVHLDDIIDACPLGVWKDQQFCTSFTLFGDKILITRFYLLDSTKSITSEELRGHLYISREDEEKHLDEIARVVNSQIKFLCNLVVSIATTCERLIQDMNDNEIDKESILHVVQVLRIALAHFGKHAVLVGWPKFLRLCEGYAEQL